MGQREKYNCNSFPREVSADPAGSSGAVMALEGPPPSASFCQQFELANAETCTSQEVTGIVGPPGPPVS